jgi:hypothetical protein
MPNLINILLPKDIAEGLSEPLFLFWQEEMD